MQQKKFGIIDSAKLFVVKERVCIFNIDKPQWFSMCHQMQSQNHDTSCFENRNASTGKRRWNFNDDILDPWCHGQIIGCSTGCSKFLWYSGTSGIFTFDAAIVIAWGYTGYKSMVVFGSPKRWDRYHSPSPHWQEKCHLYTTYSPCLLGGLCYLPPFRGTRNNHWYCVDCTFHGNELSKGWKNEFLKKHHRW